MNNYEIWIADSCLSLFITTTFYSFNMIWIIFYILNNKALLIRCIYIYKDHTLPRREQLIIVNITSYAKSSSNHYLCRLASRPRERARAGTAPQPWAGRRQQEVRTRAGRDPRPSRRRSPRQSRTAGPGQHTHHPHQDAQETARGSGTLIDGVLWCMVLN